LARRLIARAAKKNSAQSGAASTAFAACQATYRVLARSIGATGAEALLGRALALADKEYPLLREIRFDRDEEAGLGDAPWPPHFRKQAGEPKRVQPSRARKD